MVVLTRALVAMTLVVVALPANPAAGVAGFGDVAADRYYSEPIQWMVDEAITTGTSPTCFAPDRLVTRGEAAAFLHRMAGEPSPGGPAPFVDVVATWQLDPVAWLFAAGVTTGTTPTTYGPAEAVTRGQVAAMLHRLAGGPDAPAHPFVDVHGAWQQAPVSWLYETGITTGTSVDTFSPDLPVTRGQLATFLHRSAGAPTRAVDPGSPRCGGTARPVSRTGHQVMAVAGPLTLHFPADRVELVGFHESGHDGAQPIALVATGVPSTVLESRDRGTGRRTAADIVVHPADEIRAPVTGTVVRSGGYTLYCDHRDEFVVIEPDARPGWEVKMFHFDGLTVRPGDRVEAGVTVVGAHATVLPFVSQVDDVTTDPAWPHVHVEVVDPSVPDRPSRGC